MMSAAGYLAAVVPAIPCWLVLRRWGVLRDPERCAAAFGFGLGTTSVGFFVARWLGLSPATYLTAEVLFTVGAICLLGKQAWDRSRRASPRVGALSRSPLRWLLSWGAAAVLLAGAGIAAYARYELTMHPFGTSDTWAIWNVRAAFLATPGPSWRDAFAPGVPLHHQDYPLLLPGAVARLWSLVGQTPEPAGYLSVVVLVATALLVSGAVRGRAGTATMTVSLGLLLPPEFVRQGATQHADLLVGFYTVLALILVAQTPRTTPSLIAAGLACGSAAWTKNEGLVVAVALPSLAVLWAWRTDGRERAAATASDLVIGMGPILAVLALFKILLAPDNDVVSGLLTPGAVSYWTDPVRVSFVLREMVRGLLECGGWPAIPVIAAVTAVAIIPKTTTSHPSTAGAALGAALLSIQLAAFFAVYVMTPHSVAWHVATSWPRLIAQLWPTLIWSACTARVRSTEGASAG